MSDNSAVNVEPTEVARNARRLSYLSRGLSLMAVGIWMVSLGALQWLGNAFLEFKPYAIMLQNACSVGLILSQIWIERLKAARDCHVQAHRKSTVGEEVRLFLGILVGVFAVVAFALNAPASLSENALSIVGLILFLVAGGYFIYEGVRLKLIELMVLGALFSAMLLPFVYFDMNTIPETRVESGMQTGAVAFGLLIVAIGGSLHLRWGAWRKQVLEA